MDNTDTVMSYVGKMSQQHIKGALNLHAQVAVAELNILYFFQDNILVHTKRPSHLY